MWLEGIDAVFEKLDKSILNKVIAVSVSGQQHGSVYWRAGAAQTLTNLQSGLSLRENLRESFAIDDSPIWADSSTTVYCKTLEADMGGPDRLAELTGSIAYERFTGPQIARVVKERSCEWAACERVSLVSSFAASLLLQEYASIDAADASGMNLMDLRSREWILAACASVEGASMQREGGAEGRRDIDRERQ